jgi:hypothetical protein
LLDDPLHCFPVRFMAGLMGGKWAKSRRWRHGDWFYLSVDLAKWTAYWSNKKK